jgi:hypothetical protein
MIDGLVVTARCNAPGVAHGRTSGRVRVAEQNGAVVGFAVLLEPSGDACELDGSCVAPDRMRAGVGRGFVGDAARITRERGATRIDVVANPQAVAFDQSGQERDRKRDAVRSSA